jgi:hypothetical protein
MTSPSDITLQQFNDYKASAEAVFLGTIAWLEKKVGMQVLSIHLDDQDGDFIMQIAFGEFAKEDDSIEESQPEAQ